MLSDEVCLPFVMFMRGLLQTMQGRLQHFAQRGVRVYDVPALLYRATHAYQGTGFLYQVGGMGAIEMATQQTAVCFRYDEFAETIRLTHAERLAVAPEE